MTPNCELYVPGPVIGCLAVPAVPLAPLVWPASHNAIVCEGLAKGAGRPTRTANRTDLRFLLCCAGCWAQPQQAGTRRIINLIVAEFQGAVVCDRNRREAAVKRL